MHRITVLMVTFFLLFVVGDVVSTMYTMQTHKGTELNPMIAALLPLPVGWLVVGMVKIGLFLVFWGVVSEQIRKGLSLKKVQTVLIVANVLLLFIVTNNFFHYAF